MISLLLEGVELFGYSDKLQIHGANKAFISREELNSAFRLVAMEHLMFKTSLFHA
jgi:hypothetical protein